MELTTPLVRAQSCTGQILAPRDAAHHYVEVNLPITLCEPGSKKPIGMGWQHRTWTHDEIDTAFNDQSDLNVGLILGPMSGFIDVEVDGPEGDAELLDLFGGNVPVTPMWRSARGPHRLFEWHNDVERIGRSSVRMGSLEIRLGANGRGAQSLLPPSITDGWGRRWSVALDDCQPAPLPPRVLRQVLDTFGQHPCMQAEVVHSMKHSNAVFHAVYHSEDEHVSKNGHAHVADLSKSAQAKIKRAIEATLPGAPGYRNRLLLQFARLLKGITELAVLDVGQLQPYVDEWHRLALPSIDTQDFDVTWHDFVVAWNNVKYPAGEGPLAEIYAAGLKHMPAIAKQYRISGVRNLVALCRELQLRAGERPFWLACRPAAAVLGSNPTTVNRWLWKLIHGEAIELVTEGSRGKAAEYRFVAD